MSEFKKIKITSKDHPKRLYRIIAVKNDLSLLKLGYVIGASFRAWFEHGFLFQNGPISYVPAAWGEGSSDVTMNYYHLSDLGDSFTFVYDTGENYEFDCKVMKSVYKYDDFEEDLEALVIEGKGQGIFENDHWTLDRYLEGLIDPNSSEENEDEHMHLPMNMEFETYGDFDNPLDLDEFVFYEDDLNMQEELMNERDKEYLKEDKYNIFSEDIDFFENEDELEEMGEVFERALSALLIFENDEAGELYMKLLRNHGMREAFEIFHNVYSDMPEDLDEDESIEYLKDKLLLKN